MTLFKAKQPLKNKSLYRNAFQLAWPATLEGALLSIISSVDTMMVQQVDPNAIAAVSLTSQPRMILLIIAQALCVGTTALVARRKGEENREGANAVLSQSLVLVSIIGVIISLIGVLFCEPIMNLAGADGDTRELSVEYFRIICAGLMFNCWNLCICAALRAIGNTRITMVTNITANLVNVFLNWCLIGGNLGFPALGVAGAAIATVCGTAIACLISICYVCRKKGYLRLSLRFSGFDRQTLSGLGKVGSSSVAESAFLRLGFFITTRMIADIGAAALTGYTIVQQVTGLSFTLGDGVATAGATLVGQSLGAKDKKTAADYVQVCRRLSVISSIFLMIFLLLTKDWLPTLFTQDAYIIEGSSWAFVSVIFGLISQNGRVVYSGCLRGAGDVKYVALVALISVAVVRPVLTWVCCYPLCDAFPGLWFAFTGPWIAFVIDAYIRHFLLWKRVRQEKYLEIRL